MAVKAHRYYDGSAYSPTYGYSYMHPYVEWDETVKGPRPIIRPLPARITEISATMLFGEPPFFQAGFADDTEKNSLQQFLDDVLRMNEMHSQWLTEARAASLDGSTSFKFAFTPQTTDLDTDALAV